MNAFKCNLVIVVFLLFAGCVERPTDENYIQMAEDIKRIYGVKVDKDVECFIFINSKGWNVDIDRFESLELKKIVISRDARNQGTLIPDLGIIYMKETKTEIDTIISISLERIKEQIDYMEKRY